MRFDLYIVRRDILLHKIRYSKTLKGDAAGAFFGLVLGLFVGYLSLASVGSCSVDLSDLTVILFNSIFIIFILSIIFNINLIKIKKSINIYLFIIIKFLF